MRIMAGGTGHLAHLKTFARCQQAILIAVDINISGISANRIKNKIISKFIPRLKSNEGLVLLNLPPWHKAQRSRFCCRDNDRWID